MKTGKLKRIFACLLTAALLSGGMTACQSSTTEGDASGDTSSDEIVFSEPGTYPIANQTIPLKVFVSMSSVTDYDTNTFTLHLEEKTGIDLSFETCTADAATEKLNLLLTSGDYPDALFASVDENRWGEEEGILIDLTPYLDRLPLLQEQVEKYPNLLSDMKATDGKTYFLPGYDGCFQCNYSGKMWINTMHLEAMGEDIPTTTDEFYELLKKYKEYDPNGIPMCASKDGWVGDPLSYLAGSFFPYYWDTYGFQIQDDKVVTYNTMDGYRECLKYLNKLYAEGLLNADAFTLVNAQIPAILTSGNEPIFCFPSGNSQVADLESNPEIYGHYEAIAPLKGPDGRQTSMYAPIYPVAAFAVTDKCEYPEAALRLAEVFYDTEEFLNSQLGMKGEFWDTPAEGTPGIDGEPALFEVLKRSDSGQQNDHWVYRGIYHWADLRLKEASPANADLKDPQYTETLAYQTSRDLYAPYHPQDADPLPSLKFTVDESTSIQTISVEVQKVIEEQRAAFVTGAAGPNSDADWEAYLQSLDNVGLPKMLEVYQAAYDRKMSME